MAEDQRAATGEVRGAPTAGKAARPSLRPGRDRRSDHPASKACSTWQAIASELERMRVPTARGGTAWHASTVRSAYVETREAAAQAT